jgi:hypothetical protein
MYDFFLNQKKGCIFAANSIIMTTRIKILIMMILFCFSCKNGVRTDEVIPVSDIEFENRLNVSYREIKTDFLLSFPVNITLTARNFIIQDGRGHDFYYHIIDRDSGILVKDFGMKGQGPQDLLFVNWNPFYNQI